MAALSHWVLGNHHCSDPPGTPPPQLRGAIPVINGEDPAPLGFLHERSGASLGYS